MPSLILLTDGAGAGERGRSVPEVVAEAVTGGARCVLMREKHLARAERIHLARELAEVLDPVEGILLVASDATILPSGGVHLAAADPFPSSHERIVGRSCHDAAGVSRAAGEGCDYATLSPVFLTDSKPGYGPALGPAALGGHPIPVWALGGVTRHNAGSCLDAGAAGVAVMGAVMRAEDPSGEVAAILEGLQDR